MTGPSKSQPEPEPDQTVAAVDATVDATVDKSRQLAKREKGYERWRDRLVSEGNHVLTEFIEEHPMADPSRLRQLLRQARRDPGSGKSTQALREVLRLVRETIEVEASVRRAAARQ